MSKLSETGLPGMRGSDHIGFTAPDMDEAVEYLRPKGVRVLGEPLHMLVSYPYGMAYENDTELRLWKP